MSNKQPFHKILLSVFAALLGIQSRQKADEDFKETNPWLFLGVGILMILLLIAGLLTVVYHVV